MEKEKGEKYFKERKESVKTLIEQALKASEDVDGLLKEDNVSGAQTLEERSTTFNSYIKYLFETSQQGCDSKPFLSDVAAKNRTGLENTLQELQTSLAACTSLLDNSHVTTDEIERCEAEALVAIEKARDSGKTGASEGAMWNSYRELVMGTFEEISKTEPSSDPFFTCTRHAEARVC